MSHFTVTVVVPKDQVERLHPYIDEVMEPFNENTPSEPRNVYLEAENIARMKQQYGTEDEAELAAHMQDWEGCPGGVDGKGLYYVSTYNQQSKWDWWKVGGRWRGFFKVKPNMPYALGDASWGEQEPPEKGWGDIVRQGDVDWEGMMAASVEACRKEWTEWASRDAARDPAAMPQTEDEYVVANAHVASFALVDKQGEWHETGKMGWWATVTDRKDPGTWRVEWVNYVGSCHFEDMLVLLDCHI